MKYHIYTWDECYKQCKEVARLIRKSKFFPDVIVALARSGFVPGRVLSDLLMVDELFGLQVHHVMTGEVPDMAEADVEEEYEAVIPFKAPLNVKGVRVLTVDDIAGTGKSMTAAIQYLESLGPKELKTATLGYSTESIIRPDFHSATVGESDWVLYPWNYFEDFSELILKAKHKLRQHDASAEILVKAIEENFGVRVPLEELKYVLESTKEPPAPRSSK
ncbi:MAG: phosphoribosyltransferase [Candidatus Atabeyarchaeum deiterrae]|jgi:hypoxanthine phosphoribosyltransferase